MNLPEGGIMQNMPIPHTLVRRPSLAVDGDGGSDDGEDGAGDDGMAARAMGGSQQPFPALVTRPSLPGSESDAQLGLTAGGTEAGGGSRAAQRQRRPPRKLQHEQQQQQQPCEQQRPPARSAWSWEQQRGEALLAVACAPQRRASAGCEDDQAAGHGEDGSNGAGAEWAATAGRLTVRPVACVTYRAPPKPASPMPHRIHPTIVTSLAVPFVCRSTLAVLPWLPVRLPAPAHAGRRRPPPCPCAPHLAMPGRLRT